MLGGAFQHQAEASIGLRSPQLHGIMRIDFSILDDPISKFSQTRRAIYLKKLHFLERTRLNTPSGQNNLFHTPSTLSDNPRIALREPGS